MSFNRGKERRNEKEKKGGREEDPLFFLYCQ